MHHKAILANTNIPKIILKHLILIKRLSVSGQSRVASRPPKSICTWPQICTLGKYIKPTASLYFLICIKSTSGPRRCGAAIAATAAAVARLCTAVQHCDASLPRHTAPRPPQLSNGNLRSTKNTSTTSNMAHRKYMFCLEHKKWQ